MKLFDQLSNRLVLEGELEFLTAMRVGAGRSTGVLGTDLPVLRNSAGAPYIPGGSMKGAVRVYLESLARAVWGSKGACNPVDDQERCLSTAVVRELRSGTKDENEFTKAAWERACFVCRLMGAPVFQSKVHFADLPVRPDSWSGRFEVRNGIAVDRDTDTVARGKLFDFEVVPAGTAFCFRCIAENLTEAEFGLLYSALGGLERGEFQIGGARSRGLGFCRLKLSKELYYDYTSKEKALAYLVGVEPGEEVSSEMRSGWLKALQKLAVEESHA